MYISLPLLISVVITVLVTAFALWKGDAPARIAGAFNFIDVVGFIAIQLAISSQTGEVLQLAADFIWAVGLLFLAVRYASLWLGVTMLLQAAQFSLHGYYLVNERQPDRLHAWINNTNNYGILICITVGTVFAIRRRVLIAREEAEREARRQKLAAPA
jgi:hypothetical protein